MNTFFTCEQKLGATRIVAFFLKGTAYVSAFIVYCYLAELLDSLPQIHDH